MCTSSRARGGGGSGDGGCCCFVVGMGTGQIEARVMNVSVGIYEHVPSQSTPVIPATVARAGVTTAAIKRRNFIFEKSCKVWYVGHKISLASLVT